MKNKGLKLNVVEVILTAAFLVVVVGVALVLGWYAKELSLIEKRQVKFRRLIEDTQNDTRQIGEQVAGIQENHLKLRAEIKEMQKNTHELFGNMTEAIESNKLEFLDAIESLRESIQQITDALPIAQSQPAELAPEDQIQAERLYQMALTGFKIARKPMMTYHRMVRYSRELLEKYPDSPEAAKARVLLRKIPERHRKRHNITDEEMGL